VNIGRAQGGGAGQSWNPPARVEQREKQHQTDQDVITAWIRKNGAAREDGAADPWKITPDQALA
jgi:hypothetical protein